MTLIKFNNNNEPYITAEALNHNFEELEEKAKTGGTKITIKKWETEDEQEINEVSEVE